MSGMDNLRFYDPSLFESLTFTHLLTLIISYTFQLNTISKYDLRCTREDDKMLIP